MSKLVVFILDLAKEEIWSPEGENINQRIISFASLLNISYQNLYPNSQVALISIKNGLLKQISHFSGDRRHHNQGFFRLPSENFPGKFDLKDAFIFAKKLIGKLDLDLEPEIIFFSNQNTDFPFNYLCGIFLKENFKFSSILFGERSFCYEILAKMTNGFCLYVDYIFKNSIKFILKKENLKKKKNTTSLFVNPCATQFFFFLVGFGNSFSAKNNLKFFCKNCGSIEADKKKVVCDSCFNLYEDRFFVPLKLVLKDLQGLNMKKTETSFSLFSKILLENKFLSIELRTKNFLKKMFVLKSFFFLFSTKYKNSLIPRHNYSENLKKNLFLVFRYRQN